MLSGASVTTTKTIPVGSICFGVAERVIEDVTGASSFKVGISGEPGKFGDLLGLSAGATNFGIIGPTAFYADTPVIVTANDSNFTGGRLRLAIHVMRIGAAAELISWAGRGEERRRVYLSRIRRARQ